MMKNITPVALTFTLSAVPIGCADDEDPSLFNKEPKPPCSRLDDDGCEEDESSADEVGDGDTTGDGDGEGDEPHKPCSANGDVVERTMHQCNGHLSATVSFRTLYGDCEATLEDSGGTCFESHEFGKEPYGQPLVMACCDPELVTESDLLRYCASDMIEQVCLSVSARLQYVIENTDADIVKVQVSRLLDYVNNNQQECFDALWRFPDHGKIGPVSWLVNGGKNKDWIGIQDFTVTLEEGVVESASIPEDTDDYIGCWDDSLNDGNIAESRGSVAPALAVDGYQLADKASVSVAGPIVHGARVAGLAVAASQSVCVSPRCSVLELGDTGGINLTVEELSLYADAPAEVVAGDMPIEVDDLSLRLYGAAFGYYVWSLAAGTSYMVQPGDAHFIVRGSVGGLEATRWAVNRDTIRLRQTDEGWLIEPFTVVHTDVLGSAWEASIPTTIWD